MKIRSLGAFVAGVAIAIAFGVWAQAGYPTRPRFISVGIGVAAIPPTESGKLLLTGVSSGAQPVLGLDSTTPSIQLRESDAAADNRRWREYVNGEQLVFDAVNDAGSGSNWMTVDRTGNVVDSIAWSAPASITNAGGTLFTLAQSGTSYAALRFNRNSAAAGFVGFNDAAGTIAATSPVAGDMILRADVANAALRWSNDSGASSVDMTPECTATNTSTGTGWSSMPTLALSLCRVGRLVVVTITTTATGTSNSTNTNFTGAIPTRFRPSSFTCAGVIGGTNNGTGTDNVAIALETNGDITFSLTNNADCSSLGVNWTASGTKAITRSSFSYIR